jgi:hypothetical protein
MGGPFFSGCSCWGGGRGGVGAAGLPFGGGGIRCDSTAGSEVSGVTRSLLVSRCAVSIAADPADSPPSFTAARVGYNMYRVIAANEVVMRILAAKSHAGW